jgi:hypothetical protein
MKHPSPKKNISSPGTAAIAASETRHAGTSPIRADPAPAKKFQKKIGQTPQAGNIVIQRENLIPVGD